MRQLRKNVYDSTKHFIEHEKLQLEIRQQKISEQAIAFQEEADRLAANIADKELAAQQACEVFGFEIQWRKSGDLKKESPHVLIDPKGLDGMLL